MEEDLLTEQDARTEAEVGFTGFGASSTSRLVSRLFVQEHLNHANFDVQYKPHNLLGLRYNIDLCSSSSILLHNHAALTVY